MGVTNVVFNNLAVGYGDYVIPAYGVAGKLIFIAITIVNGYTSGYMPFAGYNFGAKNIKRVKSAFKFTLISSTVLCLVLLIPFLFIARAFIGAFNSNPDVIDTGVRFLHMYAICLPVLGMQFTFMSTLQVLGKAFRAMNEIENENLYRALLTVDKRTLQIVLLKMKGYSTKEIAPLVGLTTGAIYARLDHLRKKLKQFKV